MSIQWDDPERAAPFIRLLERESKAWHDAADAIQAIIPKLSRDSVEQAEEQVRDCRARAETLRNLVRHICEGDFSLLIDPETGPTS